ncbi:MAG: VCBS repeat-containing protein, partial [Candidatus Thermoplasmatota archaeon]
MRNGRWTKGLIVSIVMLFVGTSVIPSITGTFGQGSMGLSEQEMKMRTMYTSASSLMSEHRVTTEGPSTQPYVTSVKHLMPGGYLQLPNERSPLLFDDILLSSPANNDVLRAGDIIEINGTANGTTFQFYFIEWGLGENPSQWFTTGLLLENDGLVEIVNGALATWDTSFVKDIDFFTLRLTVNFSSYESDAFIRTICLDPSLKEGWPQRINFEYNPQGGYYYWAGYLEPVVDDVNNDGQQEIIVYTGGDPPKLTVFCNNGSLLWSSPVGTTDASGGNLHIPLVGDINKDGFDEIVVYRFVLIGEYSQLYVFDHTGLVMDGWPITIPKEYHPTLLIADVNNDGFDEIVFNGNDAVTRYLLIIDQTGTIIAQWVLSEKHWGSSVDSTPALGNFDNDPELEIVCASPSENAGYNSSSGEWINEGVIHMYNIDGSEVPGWPKYTDGVIFSSPATGDIDNDGDDDIIVGLQFAGNAPDYRYGGLYAFDKNGEVLPGWPFEKGWNFASSPSLADFDGDGDLE